LSLALGDGAEPGAIRDPDQNARTVPSDTVIGLIRTFHIKSSAFRVLEAWVKRRRCGTGN
jgi:hypothetical protein